MNKNGLPFKKNGYQKSGGTGQDMIARHVPCLSTVFDRSIMSRNISIGRVRERNLRVLIDPGSIGNSLSARCQTALEWTVRPEDEFERLTLADVQKCMRKGMSNLSFIVGIAKLEFSPGFFQIFIRS